MLNEDQLCASSEMGSKRSQDFLLVMSSLQKVANLVVKQEVSAASSKIKSDYSINDIVKNVKTPKLDSVSINDGQILAKKSGIILENALLMGQSLAVSSFQHNLPNIKNYNPNLKQYGFQEILEKC